MFEVEPDSTFHGLQFFVNGTRMTLPGMQILLYVLNFSVAAASNVWTSASFSLTAGYATLEWAYVQVESTSLGQVLNYRVTLLLFR